MPRKARAAARRPRRRARRAMKPRQEFATAKQVIQLPDQEANSVYALDQIRLAQFDRMVGIAKNYQYFRITRVDIKYKPFSDTYIPGTGGAVQGGSVPYLYTLVNKGNVLNASTFNSLRDAGAKPRRFDDKSITISWKPAVLQAVQDYSTAGGSPVSVALFAMKKTSPWLATNQNAGLRTATWAPSQVDHCGLLGGVEQDNAGSTGQLEYGLEITAYFEFKGPLNAPGVGVETEPRETIIIAKEEVKPPPVE